MSAFDLEHKTLRYRLGELLRDASDHLLLLTATPHKGDPINFSFFLQLLDQDAYADVRSIREAMNQRRAPFYIRRTKEAMVYFPERRPDVTWVAEKIFTKRIPHTVDFQIDGAEFDLYRDVTRFVKQQSAKAAAQGDDPRARAVGFLMSLYQRRLASSTQDLRQVPGVEAVTPAGSLRRGRETVGDLDLLVTGPNATAALERFYANPNVGEVLGRGGNKASARVGREGLQVDVRTLPPDTFGAAMQYFTGSKDHNVAIRTRAVKMGLKLSEYGLFRVEDESRVAGETEAGVYEAMGLPWIPPELRENAGEIEAALEGRLPELIELKHIRGDLHMHTTETDGRATLEEMAEAARRLGYEYIAITDHSKALAMANGLDERRAVAFAKQVREINRDGLGLRVFSGLECDILRDGAMDLANDALAELDVVTGSVHSHMNMEAAEITDRLLRALECPHLRILGHPTGRLLLQRDPFPFDFDRVVAEAVRRGVWLEINASPERLDLHGPLIRSAKAKGARFTISTDAHHPKHLAAMRYGVVTARRGWLGPTDVMNTLPANAFAAALKK